MDKTLLMSWALMTGGIFTAILSFVILAKISKKNVTDKKQDKLAKDTKELQTRLETQINSLQDELKKTKVSYAAVENELQELKKTKADLSRELLKHKDSSNANNIELARLRKENSELKDKLANKEKELENKLSQSLTVEKELEKKNEDFQVLEKENKAKNGKSRDLEAHLTMPPTELKVTREKLNREQKKEKIGEILLEHNFINKDVLDKALKYQEESGGSVTQYLLAYGYIDEGELAQCLCTQFGIPYLPLNSYKIPEEIIKLVPVDIAEKYWLIPVEKVGSLIMVVMADPFDAKAIKGVEEITGCGVQPFVGILSEIIESLESYYKVAIKVKDLKSKRAAPFFIDASTYKGPERRESVRIKAKIDVSFPAQGRYIKSKTKDVSRIGFLLESENLLSVGSLVTLEISLPKECNPLPIAAIVQVIRVKALENNKFEMGVKIIKISKQELDTIIEYASLHQEA